MGPTYTNMVANQTTLDSMDPATQENIETQAAMDRSAD